MMIKTYTASDADTGDVLTWSKEGDDEDDFTLTENSGMTGYELKFSAVPDFENPADKDTNNEYKVTVKVTDDETPTAMSGTLDVTITVTNVNEAPTITTSEMTKNVAENTTAVLTFEASDVDASDTKTWLVETADDGGKFEINSSGELSFKTAPNFEMPNQVGSTDNEYEVTVKVTDSGGLSDTQDLDVTVTNVNEAPTITTSEMTKSVAENTTAVLTFEASDVDASDTKTWLVETADDGGKFEINSSGELSFKTAPNFEMPNQVGSTDNEYEVTVKVTDSGGLSDTQDLDVTVTNVNEEPTFGTTPSDFSKDENTPNTEVIASYTASDVDADDNPGNLVWTLLGEDVNDFTLVKNSMSNNAELKFDASPNYEVPTDDDDNDGSAGDNQYEITIKVADDGNLSAEESITVTVNNVNEAPTFGTMPSDLSKDENTPNTEVIASYTASDVDADDNPGNLVWTLLGEDANDFTLVKNSMSNNAELKFDASPNYEVPTDDDDNDGSAGDNQYEITIKVSDDGNLSAEESITVTVDDVNETPVVSGTAGPSFPEIEYDVDATAMELIIGTYTATDDDNTDNSVGDADYQTITWKKNGADAAHFSIDSMSGELSFSIEPDFEDEQDADTDNEYVVVVEADDGEMATNSVGTVTVTNVNERPDITEFLASELDMNGSHPHMEVEYDSTVDPLPDVHPFTATDYDVGDAFTWSHSGTDAGDFEIDTNNGVLTFKQPSDRPNTDDCHDDFQQPDFEVACDDDTDNTYSITVIATDNQGKAEEYDITVTVTDVNERPDIREDTVPNYPEVDFYYTLTPDMVHEFAAVDYDGDTFEWSLMTGDDAGDFNFDPSTGVLTFVQNSGLNVGPLPSYEDPLDADTDNTYEITVIATDDDSYAAEYDVTITVTDDEEEGRVAAELPNDPPLVDDELTFTLSDPDGGIVLTAGDIDWTIEARNPGDTEQDWESIDDDDPLSLVKTYTVDEDYTGKEIRATVTYKDRYDVENTNPSNTIASDDTNSVMDKRAVAPPRFRESASQKIPEGEAGRDTDVEIMATDRDGEVLVFGIQDGQDSDLFEIIPSDSTVTRTIQNVDYTGYAAQLRAIEALDYETVTSRSSTCPSKSLCLTLTLSDGKAFSNGRVIYDDTVDVTYDATIEVTDVEEPGEITFSPEEVPEPGVQIEATLTDPDGSIGGRSWQWQRSEDAEAEEPVWTPISGATSSTYTPSATADVVSGGDNDGEGYYLRATVSYTDGKGSGKSAEAIAGQVGTANTRPQFPTTETGQRTVPENSRAGTNIGEPVAAEDPENNSLTYTLTGFDAESFTIVSSTGQLRVREPLDFENGQTQYFFNVDIHDRRDAAGRSSSYIDDTQLVIITVENVDEEGTVTLSTPTNRVQATVPVTADLTDPDNASGITWQWARSSNRSDWTDITNAANAVYNPTAVEDQGNYLRATATYTDGEGSNKTAEIVTSRVAGPPPTNPAPVVPDAEDGQREVHEDAGDGTTIVGPVEATDFNGDTLTYSLSGSDSAYFTIGTSGQLSLQLEQDETLDYKRKRTYRFTVRVSDGKNDAGEADDPNNLRIDDSISVTVSLIDINEPPVITGEAEREFRENGTSAVSTYSARDPEGDSITWSVSGTDGDSFVITDRGQLYFNEPPSLEARDPSEYSVTVTATDDDETSPLSASLNVTVTVTDVEEQGTVSIFPPRGWVVDAVPDDTETPDTDEALPALQTRFTAVLEDGDTPITNLTWQWARSSSEDITDETSDSYKATIEDVNRSLRVTATYDDSFDDSDSQGDPVPETATAALRTRIRDTSPGVNTQPEFTVPTAEELPDAHFDTRTITSGPTAGRSIGSRVSARDAEGDVLTYMLRGREAEKFDIDAATGQIRTREALDYREQDTYTLSVSVHDGFDVTYRPSASIDDTISIIITVLPPPPPRRTVRRSTTVDTPPNRPLVRRSATDDTPPNRPAEFSDGDTTNRSVVQGVESGTSIGRPVAASDPDGDSLTYTLAGTDGESFDIDAATGQLKTKATLDAETKSSYSVTVSVTDNKNAGGGRLAEIDDAITVTITVTTVELPEIANRYDADENGLISRDEAIAAVNDFFSGDITRDQALEVIALYFDSPATAPELLGESG